MSAITPTNNFYKKIEAYKKSLQQNRPKNMTDAQFNEQVERYTVGLQRDEFKRSNKENGINFAKDLSMEKNGTAKAIEEKQFAEALEQEKQWLEASRRPKIAQGIPVNKNRADAVKERQIGSQLKGEIKQLSHIENLEMRAESGNSSPLKKAKIKRSAEKQIRNLIDRILKRTPDYHIYEDKVNSKRVQRRIRNYESSHNNIKETVKENTKNLSKLSWKGKLGIAMAALGVIGGVFYAGANKDAQKTNQINNAA